MSERWSLLIPKPSSRARASIVLAIGTLSTLGLGGCGPPELDVTTALSAVELVPIPALPDLENVDSTVAAQFEERRTWLERVEATPSASSSGRAWAWARLGEAFHAYQRFDDALPCYRNASALEPTNPRWPYLLAHALRKLGSMKESEAQLNRVLELSPDHVGAATWKGEGARERSELEAARSFYDRALAVDPRHAYALAGRAQIELSSDPAAAIQLLERALESQPLATNLHLLMAQALQADGRRDEARPWFERVPDLETERTPLRFEDPWLEAVSQTRVGAQYHARRAQGALARGHEDLARNELELAVAANPERSDTRYNLAATLLELGERERALNELAENIERNADHTLSIALLARVLAADGDDDQALRFLNQALGKAESFELLLARADILLDAEGPRGAAAAYERATQLKPSSVRGHFGAGLAQYLAGHEDVAIRGLQESANAFPDAAPLRHLLARLLACARGESQDIDQAQVLSDELSTLAGETNRLQETLALIASARGDFDRAIELQSTVVVTGSDDRGDAVASRKRLTAYENGQKCPSPWTAREGSRIERLRAR